MILLCFLYAQHSLILVEGTGDPTTSAHITVSAQGINKAYLEADELCIEDGATLVVWNLDAVSGQEICGGNIIYLEPTVEIILQFFDDAVAGGTLEGVGRGNSAEKKLNALRNMIKSAAENVEEACEQLYDAYSKTDGEPNPPDFVEGSAAIELSLMILELMEEIGCEAMMGGMMPKMANSEIPPDSEEKESNEVVIPDEFKLQQNHPNPFNPYTQIRFQLPEANFVLIRIFNTLGQQVRNLVNRRYEAGFHHVIWDSKDNIGNSVPTGVYVYRIEAGEFQDVKKMILIK